MLGHELPSAHILGLGHVLSFPKPNTTPTLTLTLGVTYGGKRSVSLDSDEHRHFSLPREDRSSSAPTNHWAAGYPVTVEFGSIERVEELDRLLAAVAIVRFARSPAARSIPSRAMAALNGRSINDSVRRRHSAVCETTESTITNAGDRSTCRAWATATRSGKEVSSPYLSNLLCMRLCGACSCATEGVWLC